MSKHEKQVRHEKRKVERTRRRRSFFSGRHPLARPLCGSHIKHGAAALAAAAVIAAGTQAYASPVRFDNLPEGAPGWFDWKTPNPPETRRWLDVTLDVASQPLGLAGVVSEFGHASSASPFGEVVARDDLGIAGLQVGGFYDYVLVGVDSGVLIPSGLAWGGRAFADYYGTETPEGAPSYLGVKFDPGDGVHYGWIGVERTGTRLATFAWGYETTPGVPIEAGVPEPGSLALLAFGAAAALRKRRQA